MSTITSVSSNPNFFQNGNVQVADDFNAIGSALLSGNVASTQSALVTFQQALQSASQTPSNPPFGANTQANTDYQLLTNAIKSGNLAAAQKAYTSLQTDLKSDRGAHHHHHGAGSTSSTTTTATPSAPAAGILNITA